MEEIRLPKQLFYGVLQHDKCPRHKPKKHFKDVIKKNLKVFCVYVEHWEQMTKNQSALKKGIYDGCKSFEIGRIE